MSSPSPNTPRALSRYLPLIVWLGVIWYASSGEFSSDNTSLFVGPLLHWLFPDISTERLAFLHGLVRKAAHFCEYFILGILASRAFFNNPSSVLARFWFRWSMALVVFYALLDEYHQSFVPTRSASIYDSLIDILGGATAIALFSLWTRKSSPVTDQSSMSTHTR